MSLSSSETAINASPPRIAYMFLAKFDHREGYKMVWGSPHDTLDMLGLEYKALPSGVHEYEATTIYLAHESRGKLYYGAARFRQVNENAEGGLDRLLVNMYSLGILVEPLKGKYWKPHEFSTLGWEHLGALDLALQQFIKTEDLALLSQVYLTLSGADLLLEVPRPVSASNADHPLTKLPMTLSTVGPLIFPLFKAALLRKNILIFNHSSQGSGTLILEPSPRGPAACGALAYILSLISVVPKNAHFRYGESGHADGIASFYSQPLYTVGLHDVDANFLSHYPGYIASTSDEILKMQRQLYDYAVVMPASDYDFCLILPSGNINDRFKATYNDYGKFLRVYKSLPQNSENRHLANNDDQSSIRTSSSIFSAFKFGYFSDNKDEKLHREPAWWFSGATSPMSWREYIWLAFAWFASAGTTERKAEKIDLDAEESRDEASNSRGDLLQLTSIVGHFHELTRKWFYIIEEIISESTGGVPTDQQTGEKITLELTPQDIVDMELDPYSAQDLEFVREFVLTYWGSTVDDVEIGLGIHNFFC